MNNYITLKPFLIKLLFFSCLLSAVVVSASTAIGAGHQKAVDTGYSALKLFLEDEQHLTTIRRVKLVLAFESISDKSTRLIDAIADSSEQALEDLEKLAKAKPVIIFEDFSDESIGKATLDSLRMTTAKEFLLETDDFEKDLLLSQSQILRVISHLAKQLEEIETNSKRKAWLNKLAKRYDNYYRQVYARLKISTRSDT